MDSMSHVQSPEELQSRVDFVVEVLTTAGLAQMPTNEFEPGLAFTQRGPAPWVFAPGRVRSRLPESEQREACLKHLRESFYAVRMQRGDPPCYPSRFRVSRDLVYLYP
jgi:hypothetical protein